MKRMIEIIVFESDSCIYKLQKDAKEFIRWWQDKIDIVPDEYKNSTQIICSTNCKRNFIDPSHNDGYGDYYATIAVKIYYSKLETDEEHAKRLKGKEDEEARKREQEMEEEIKTLIRLKKKYELSDLMQSKLKGNI